MGLRSRGWPDFMGKQGSERRSGSGCGERKGVQDRGESWRQEQVKEVTGTEEVDEILAPLSPE